MGFGRDGTDWSPPSSRAPTFGRARATYRGATFFLLAQCQNETRVSEAEADEHTHTPHTQNMNPRIRGEVSNIEANASDGTITIRRVDSYDMRHMLSYRKTKAGTIVSVVTKRPSSQVFADPLDTERCSIERLRLVLESVGAWTPPARPVARVDSDTRSIRVYEHVHGTALSRRSILVVEDERGNVAAGRNVTRLSHVPVGWMFPIFGRIVSYRQYKNETKKREVPPSTKKHALATSLADELGRRTSSRNSSKYLWCNSLDCPTKENGQWWAIHADARALYLKLLNVGSRIHRTDFWLPDSFITSFQAKCELERERLTDDIMRDVFDNHEYKFDERELDVERLRAVLDSRVRLNALLVKANAGPANERTLKGIKALSRELRFELRRFLRFHLNRMMQASRFAFDEDEPNSVVVTELSRQPESRGHQLRAYLLVVRDIEPLETLRVAPFN